MKPKLKKYDALELELKNFSNSTEEEKKPIADGKFRDVTRWL